MSWEAVIAIVETVGLLAVFASLVYVALQVRQNSDLISQNTLVARSSMVHDRSVSYARFFELIAESSELASIYRRGINFEELDPNEITRFEALLAIHLAHLEDTDHQHKSNLYFDEEDDTDLIQFMAPSFRHMLSTQYGRAWWDRTGKDSFAPSFYDKIQEIRAGWDAEQN